MTYQKKKINVHRLGLGHAGQTALVPEVRTWPVPSLLLWDLVVNGFYLFISVSVFLCVVPRANPSRVCLGLSAVGL